MKRLISCILLGMLPVISQAEDHAAHVHGVGQLDIAIEGNKLVIALDGPADNLLGFEHAPKTAQEKATLQEVSRKMQDVRTLFVPNASAGCRLSQQTVKMPEFKASGHSDIEAEYDFVCTAVPQDITLTAWANFPRYKKMVVNLALPGRQKQLTLLPGQKLSLK